jgi:hypothetical protein
MTISIYLGEPGPAGPTTADVSLGDEGYPIVLGFTLDRHEALAHNRAEGYPALARRVEELELIIRGALEDGRVILDDGTDEAQAVAFRTLLVNLEAAAFRIVDGEIVGAGGYPDIERHLDPTKARELAAALVHYAGETEAGRR